MNYTIRSKANYSMATIDFYIQFSENDGFLEYMITQKGLKKKFNALSVAASRKNNTLRVTMPFGTDEKKFAEATKKTLQFLYNMFGMKSYSQGCDSGDLFGSFFGG